VLLSAFFQIVPLELGISNDKGSNNIVRNSIRLPFIQLVGSTHPEPDKNPAAQEIPEDMAQGGGIKYNLLGEL
jgi:hypothetical protein